jgi:hypothetical protein
LGKAERVNVRRANSARAGFGGMQRPLPQRSHVGKAPFFVFRGGKSDFTQLRPGLLAPRLQPSWAGAKFTGKKSGRSRLAIRLFQCIHHGFPLAAAPSRIQS